MIFITYQSNAAIPLISGSNLSYTASWDFDSLDGLILDNVSSQNGNITLTTETEHHNSSGSDFLSGSFNGTIFTHDKISLGLISNYNFSTGTGWSFESSSDNQVLSYYDSVNKAGILKHQHEPELRYSELDFINGTGTGIGTLVGDITLNDEIYYSIDKSENMTLSDLDVGGYEGSIESITIYAEYNTSKVFTGNYSLHIYNTFNSSYVPLNITPVEADPAETDIIRFDTLNSSLLSLFDTWSKLSELQLYWENNCEQASKNVNWDRVWVNISYNQMETIISPNNSASMNYTLNKNFSSPNTANELILNFQYIVEMADNIQNSLLKLQLDGFEIWSEPIPPTGTIKLISIDTSSYLFTPGQYELSYELYMDYTTSQIVNCSIRMIDVQIHTRNGTYLSDVYDAGKNVIWEQISWLEESGISGYSIIFETRSGYSSDTNDGSWSNWSGALMVPAGSDIDSPSKRFMQYRITFYSEDAIDAPSINTVNIKYRYFKSSGSLQTIDFSPVELVEWCNFYTNNIINNGMIDFYYSTNSGSSWNAVPANGSLSNIPPSSSQIRIKAELTTTDNSISPVLFDFSISYKTLNHLPTSSDLLFPSDRSYINSITPTFNWTESIDDDFGDSVTYTLYYSTDPNFVTDVVTVSNITTMYYTPIIPLLDDEIYYWKIIPQDSHGASNDTSNSRSNIFITNTRNDPPDVPQLLTPGNNTIINSKSLSFDWTDSADPDFGDVVSNYTMEISTDPNFNNNIISIKGITTSFFNLDFILLNNLYYWHVQAVDTNGAVSDFQQVPYSFTINISYPKIYPEIDDIITGEDFPISLNLMDHIDQIYINENISWNIVDADTALFNWQIYENQTLSVEPVPDEFGHDTFSIELYSDGILRDTQDVGITIQSINDPPRITPLLPNSLFHTISGISLSVNLDNFAVDVEDDPESLYWTYDEYNEELFFIEIVNNPDILYIYPYNNTSGIDLLNLYLWDSDGDYDTQAVIVNITPKNNPPSISGLPDLVLHHDENYYLDLTPYINDPDTPIEELMISDDSDYVGFNTAFPFTAIFKFPKSKMDELINVKLSVSDGQFTDFDEITVYISDNNIPQIKAIPDIYFDEDTHLNFAIDLDDYFHDVDGDLLEYSYFGNENIHIDINKDHSIDLSSKPDWHGEETVVFRASDPMGALVEDSVNIYIYPINDPPEVTLTDLEIVEEIRINVDLDPYIDDIDTPKDRLEIEVDNAYITVSGLNLSFYYPVGINFDVFNLVVFDGEDYTNETISVIVRPNKPPVIDEIPDLIIHYDYEYKFNLQPYIFDEDNESEDLILTTDSDYIKLDLHTPLMIILNFPKSYLGNTISIRVEVSDGLLYTIDYFKVMISDDWAPELVKPLPNLVFMEDTKNLNVLNLNDYFIDKDDDIIDFKVLSDYIQITVHENGLIDVTAVQDWYGTEFVTLGALDEHGAFAEDTIRVEFESVNDAPVISPIPSQVANINEIWSLNIQEYISDIDTPLEDLVIETNSKYVDVSEFTLFFHYPGNITQEEILITVSDGDLSTNQILLVNLESDEKEEKDLLSFIILFLGIVLIIIAVILLLIFHRQQKKAKRGGRYRPGEDPHEDYNVQESRYKTVENNAFADITSPSLGQELSSLKRNASIARTLSEVSKTYPGHPSKYLEEFDEKNKSDVALLTRSRSYLIEEPKPEKTFEIFNKLTKKGMDGLCITRTHPNIVRKKYGVEDQPIIWLTSSKQVKNESYIPPPSLSRISLVVSNFLQKKSQGIVVLEGFEFLLNRDDFKTVLKLIHFLNDLIITNKSILLIPLDPKALSESDLHMLERDSFIIHHNDKIKFSKFLKNLKKNLKDETKF